MRAYSHYGSTAGARAHSRSLDGRLVVRLRGVFTSLVRSTLPTTYRPKRPTAGGPTVRRQTRMCLDSAPSARVRPTDPTRSTRSESRCGSPSDPEQTSDVRSMFAGILTVRPPPPDRTRGDPASTTGPPGRGTTRAYRFGYARTGPVATSPRDTSPRGRRATGRPGHRPG